MNTTQSNHSELLPFLGKRFSSISSLSPFFNLLEKDPRPGVNDFSVHFHRTAFDYCDAQYIIIRHKGEQNIIRWDWSQYGGYRADTVSDLWFDEVCQEGALMGTCERNRYNHWEYDSNRGRFCSSTSRSVIRVKVDGSYRFIALSTYKDNKACPFITDSAFEDVIGDWHHDSKAGDHVIEVVESGVTLLLTRQGLRIPKERDLKAELAQARATMTDKGKILTDWIHKGMPCARRYGFAFRGAQARAITAEEAEKMLPAYSFGMGFYDLSFELLGAPTLVFNEYSESDMW